MQHLADLGIFRFFNWHQITYFPGENVVISCDEILTVILRFLINIFLATCLFHHFKCPQIQYFVDN